MMEEGFLIHLASIYPERGCNSFGVMREGLPLFILHHLRVTSFAVNFAVLRSCVDFGETLLPLWNGAERMEREKTCPNYPK